MKRSKLVRVTFAFCILCFTFYISSCSIQQKISRSANLVIKDSSLQTAHIGISIYEPGTGKYWYNYQGDKYFVPASNTKIPTCYAAMKYLGDSLVGLRYAISDMASEGAYIIQPTGDPTFLHPDFKNQPVLELLKKLEGTIFIDFPEKEFDPLGSGWAWNDYQEYYMAERSPFPIYGNLVKIIQKQNHNYSTPDYFTDKIKLVSNKSEPIKRPLQENVFELDTSVTNRQFEIPFVTDNRTISDLLYDTLKGGGIFEIKKNTRGIVRQQDFDIIHSQPTDSLLKPMMHRSDNFFAEQSLLMVSNERLGVMSDEKIIDTLLKTDFKDLPQKPRWVDGCGLSRYNLFTPQDFVFILHKMQQEFGMDRVKNILATGGEGTLSNYYKADKGFIYAKTGSLSGVLCLSGFLYTKKNKLLIFSVLVNNYRSVPSAVRKAVEKFLESTRNSF